MNKTKNFFAQNVKFLRNRKKMTQETIASELKITRQKFKSYEMGYAKNPPLEDLMRFSEYFGINIDNILRIDLSKLSELKIRELESNENYMTGTKLRILATTVDKDNNDNIEVVPVKAKAGYLRGMFDLEFIQSLPKFQLPFLDKGKKYRAFQLDGDSMLPIKESAFVVCEYIEDWKTIKDGIAYYIVTKDDFAFKIVYNQIKNDGTLLMKSLNYQYKDYTVKAGEVREIWKYKCRIEFEIS